MRKEAMVVCLHWTTERRASQKGAMNLPRVEEKQVTEEAKIWIAQSEHNCNSAAKVLNYDSKAGIFACLNR